MSSLALLTQIQEDLHSEFAWILAASVIVHLHVRTSYITYTNKNK